MALPARAAVLKKGQGGTSYFFAAGKTHTQERLDQKLDEIASAERDALRERITRSQIVTAEADRLTDYLSWLGIIVGLGAIFLGLVAVQALRQNAAARRQAESESDRAAQLEEAVRDRTQELWEANQALKSEAIERQAAEAGLAQRVRFIGRVDAATQAGWYARARWYVSLPESDSVSVSVLEALAHGCIPLLSDLPANHELIDDRRGIDIGQCADRCVDARPRQCFLPHGPTIFITIRVQITR